MIYAWMLHISCIPQSATLLHFLIDQHVHTNSAYIYILNAYILSNAIIYGNADIHYVL